MMMLNCKNCCLVQAHMSTAWSQVFYKYGVNTAKFLKERGMDVEFKTYNGMGKSSPKMNSQAHALDLILGVAVATLCSSFTGLL
jgi:hypothetical protein